VRELQEATNHAASAIIPKVRPPRRRMHVRALPSPPPPPPPPTEEGMHRMRISRGGMRFPDRRLASHEARDRDNGTSFLREEGKSGLIEAGVSLGIIIRPSPRAFSSKADQCALPL
jgi:hypothetical protein